MSESPSAPAKPKLRLQIWGIVIGSLLTVAPVFGFIGTVIGMRRSFNVLGTSGIGGPSAVSVHINGALMSTLAGLVLCPVGIGLLILSLVSYSKRKKAIREAEDSASRLSPR